MKKLSPADRQAHSKISISKRKLVGYSINRVLGDGAYSVVYQVIRKSDNKEYALK